MLNEPEEIAEQKTSDVGLLTLRKDGLITFEPLEGKTEQTLASIKKELAIFQKWANGKPTGLLADNRNLKRFEADIRVFAQENIPQFANRSAVIVRPGISSFLINMFIYLNKPPISLKIFTNKEEAFKWLHNY